MRALLLALAILGPLETADAWIQRRVQAARVPALEAPMEAASRVGRPVVVLGALLAIAVLDGTGGIRVARLSLLALAPTNLAVEGLKRVVRRARPDGERDPANSSFPSSHAANAFALAAVFARRWRRVGAAAWLAAAVVAVSRIYLNRHFASDVIVGAALGVASAAWAARWGARWAAGPGPRTPSGVGRSAMRETTVAAG